MKLLNVPLARVTWIFDITLLNPRGVSFNEVFSKLGEKYRFAKVPKNVLDVNDQKAWAFQFGTYVSSRNLPLHISLSAYSDGLVADTGSSTDDSTEFLEEITAWIAKDLGSSMPPSPKIKKGYLSQLHVESDVSLSTINPKLTPFLRGIESQLKTLDNKPRKFEMAAIGFWAEDTNITGGPAAFRFERKQGTALDSRQYFSQAPLGTSEHLKALQELEKLLRS